MTVSEMGKRAKAASRALANAGILKNKALYALADALATEAEYILAETAKDLANGEANGMSKSLLDRLALNDS